MTRAEYTTRAHQLCATVNARRIWRGKEPLRELHIMRVVRLMLGPAPAPQYRRRNRFEPTEKAQRYLAGRRLGGG